MAGRDTLEMLAMDVIFTDLDGTLLDHATYAWQPAQPAIDVLRQLGIPWILVTSKTRAEVEWWRAQLRNEHPFIVENGGAAYIPDGYFPSAPDSDGVDSGCWRLAWGTPYGQLVEALDRASRASGCRVRGFHQLTPPEISVLCDLPQHQALLAKQREYDEPFEVLDLDRSDALAAEIARAGLRCTRGGRFWHILGANDKGHSVAVLLSLFRQAHGGVRAVGLGDAPNDAPFLGVVDVPVVIPSPRTGELKTLVPHAIVASEPGPAGWNRLVLSLVAAEPHK